MSEHPHPYPAEPDRIDRLESRMGLLEERLRAIGSQISTLTWAVGLGFGLGFPVTFAIIGWMWTSLSGDIGGLRSEFSGLRTEFGGLRAEFHAEFGGLRGELGMVRADVVELQRALPALELRIADRINTAERTLADRIHSLELAFTRAGIEFGPPRTPEQAPEPDGGGTPGQQGMLEPAR